MTIPNMVFSITAIMLIMFKVKNDKTETILSDIGNRAIGIYFIHLFILKIVRKVFELILINDVIKILIITLITYVISYYMIKMLSKITKGKLDKILGFI